MLTLPPKFLIQSSWFNLFLNVPFRYRFHLSNLLYLSLNVSSQTSIKSFLFYLFLNVPSTLKGRDTVIRENVVSANCSNTKIPFPITFFINVYDRHATHHSNSSLPSFIYIKNTFFPFKNRNFSDFMLPRL